METVAIEASRPRRTQAERRAETRGRLLDAALDCLVEHGYGGTTTTLVSQRAGVSRGAQLHHFPSRADLVAAAIEHLFDRLRSEYQEAFSTVGGGDVAAAVDLLWSMFEKPHFAAVVELYVAARTDAELRERLLVVSADHHEHVFRLARQYYTQLASRGELEDLLTAILDAMHGMAVAHFLHGGLPDRERRLAVLRGLALAAVGEGAS